MALRSTHHIIFAAISYPSMSKHRGGNTGEEANSTRAPCSNCGDQWLLPVRGLAALPQLQPLNAGIHKLDSSGHQNI